MNCFICGQEMTCSTETYHYKECGLDNVYLENVEVCRCKECNESTACIPAVPQLNNLIGETLLQKEFTLNGKEIRYLRKNMGLKAVELKKVLGVDNATISRWETGKQRISSAHDRLLRMVYANFKGIAQEDITAMVKDKFSRIELSEVFSNLYQIDLSKLSDSCLFSAI
jgi:putative zinc finger/helix-turn-helix YgiT family protein